MRRITLLLLTLVALVAAIGTNQRPDSASDLAEAYQQLLVTFPTVPDPFYCQIAPRPVVNIDLSAAALLTADDATRRTAWLENLDGTMPTEGEAADAATVTRVARTVYLLYACHHAGDLPRPAAAVTDARLAAVAGSPLAGELMTTIQAGVAPVAVVDRIELLGLSEVAVLPDGRIGWRLDLVYPDGTTQRQYGIVQLEAGRYQLDQIVLVTPVVGAVGEVLPDVQVSCDQVERPVFVSVGPGLEPGWQWNYGGDDDTFAPDPYVPMLPTCNNSEIEQLI